jgi:hypothetical protein
MNWKFGDIFDEWKGKEGMSNLLAVGGDHSVVSAEVPHWYSTEVRLKLQTKV